MKICIYADPHWSQYSSIVRKRGERYSVRLENEIKSINWVMRLAEENNCEYTVCLGDFLDKAEVNAEEISAFKEIEWSNMKNFFIAGNHEMFAVDHKYSSSKIFNLLENGEVITDTTKIDLDNVEIYFIPYILEADRKPLIEYLYDKNDSVKRVIFSHNDIAGIQMGPVISKEGFTIDEIESNCDLFINGHLHNGVRITDKIINAGNITGQNFSEDANRYIHSAFILDTDNLSLEEIENPFALNFYKIDIEEESDIDFNNIKNNAVITFKCKDILVDRLKEEINNNSKIIESRVIIENSVSVDEVDIIEDFSVDHLKTFYDYILNTFDKSDIVIEELNKIIE